MSRRSVTASRLKSIVDSIEHAPKPSGEGKPSANGKASSNGKSASPFRSTMPLGEFLFAYLHSRGVTVSFGVPGDFALPTFAWLEKSPIESVTMTHEPGAGFAADAYARVNGLGLVCVTYCVGGLNVLNAIAGAYAEKSPVVVISGAPGRKDREKDPLLHHKVKTFDTQRHVYDEVTCATTCLLDEATAASEIVRVVEACISQKRPVYIEIPHDIVDKEIPITTIKPPAARASDPDALKVAVAETIALLAKARRPVIYAGVELHRYGLADHAIKLAEKLNIPIAADLLSKSVIRERHPLYLGVYGGAISSNQSVRDYVESADCVLMLGTFITDMSLGIYTAKLDRARSVLATTESINICYHKYDDVSFEDYLKGLVAAKPQGAKRKIKIKNPPLPTPLAKSELRDELTVKDLMRIVGLNLDERSCVVSDVGDAIFGAVGIQTNERAEFIAPAYYLSMGFSVPAGIGVEMADRKIRPFVLVGDGAFQMTGTEVSTAVRLGLRPIILILNNDGYGTMRKVRDGSFNVITQWRYGKICELVGGGEASIAKTKGELDGEIKAALGSNQLRVIEVILPRSDMSPQLKNMTDELGKLRGRKA